MKKGINILWIGFVLLTVVACLLSQARCVKFVPTHLEGIPIKEDGTYTSFGDMTFSLPEPTYYNAFSLVIKGSLVCIVAFWLRNVFLNVVGNLAALLQMLLVCLTHRLEMPTKKQCILPTAESVRCADHT